MFHFCFGFSGTRFSHQYRKFLAEVKNGQNEREKKNLLHKRKKKTFSFSSELMRPIPFFS